MSQARSSLTLTGCTVTCEERTGGEITNHGTQHWLCDIQIKPPGSLGGTGGSQGRQPQRSALHVLVKPPLHARCYSKLGPLLTHLSLKQAFLQREVKSFANGHPAVEKPGSETRHDLGSRSWTSSPGRTASPKEGLKGGRKHGAYKGVEARMS